MEDFEDLEDSGGLLTFSEDFLDETKPWTENTIKRFETLKPPTESDLEEKRKQAWMKKRATEHEKRKGRFSKDRPDAESFKEKRRIWGHNRYKWKNKTIDEVELFKPDIVIDLSFIPLQSEVEHRSIATQLSFSYNVVKVANRPCRLHFTSFVDPISSLVQKQSGFPNWKAFSHPEPFYELFDSDKIVYLTPDSPNELETIDHDKVYIIGGISDGSNQMKDSTYRFAVDNGWETAKFPIKKYIDPDIKKTVLNINHAVQIVMSVAETGNWKEALDVAVPQRFRRDNKKE